MNTWAHPVLCLVFAATLARAEMTPFVIPLDQAPGSSLAARPSPIQPDSARITSSGEHFTLGAKRVRIWGVNNSFAANLPSHRDAERLAARLGAAGINSVRFHHMDTSAWPNGLLDRQDPLKLAPEALDRLDYFVAQLASNGIYANINLHVGRAASRALKLPDPLTHYDKIVGIFTPDLIQAQKQFATDLLCRTNKYRHKRYADDPAVAFVEITNEDSLFMWSAVSDLKALPDYYQQILRSKYATWLGKKYRGTDALRQAWSQGCEPAGTNMLQPRNIPAAGSKETGWRLEQHNGAAAKLDLSQNGTLQVKIAKNGSANWHIQAKQVPLAVKAGQYYTLSFRARADQPRTISYSLGQDHKPWNSLGLNGSAELTGEWKLFRAGFLAGNDDTLARLSFSLGNSSSSVELADVSLVSGGQQGLQAEESIEKASIALFADCETDPRTIDRFSFLAETEKAYFDEMCAYLKKDVGTRALITGTIVFGPCGLYAQSSMDYIDAHAYWQHPHFPGKPWDSGNWIVEQRAMVDEPAKATLPGLASERLAGKPFTVSEYNHPAPNDFQAECVPMIAAYAAAQDWAGIWFYTYSHSGTNFDRSALNSYFDIDANTAKWGFIRPGAIIYRDAGIPALPRSRETGIGPDTLLNIARLQMRFDRDSLAVAKHILGAEAKNFGLDSQIKVNLADNGRTAATGNGPAPLLDWSLNDKGLGTFHAEGPASIVVITHQPASAPVRRGNVELTAPGFAALTVTPLDGLAIADSRRILIAACGRCENTGMGFSADRRTVGKNWGNAPVQIETVSGKILLPAGNWSCCTLKPNGQPGNAIPVDRDSGGQPALILSPNHRTMWYLAEKK